MFADPSRIDTSLDCRAVTFENPTGARGAGGSTAGGRKGAPSRRLAPGEHVTLAEIDGPGVIRHIWMTFPPAPPEEMRAMQLDVYYDGATDPSVSVPALDFFGLPHGRPVPYASALTSAQEGRGFNAYFPMPFRRQVRVDVTNSSSRHVHLYFQIDYTLQPDVPEVAGLLHATFRRENPTTQQRDFVIGADLAGPGRFLGCCVGVRPLDAGIWYGEGELKVYLDGDRDLPTICGTGLEDYVGTAWGMGPHAAPFAGCPLDVRPDPAAVMPDFVGFYRWHLPDPIVFRSDIRVAIQQIGMALFVAGQEDEFDAYRETNPAAGTGWIHDSPPGVVARGIAERADDFCATAFFYLAERQAVPTLDVAAAIADIERRPYEQAGPIEQLLALDA